MPKLIDAEKIIERINERINSLPQSRVELGGFHSGQLAAYQNIIDDLRTGTFDPTPVQPDIPKQGDTVRHKTYGIGLVIDADDHIATVNFNGLLEIPFLHELEVIK